MSAERSLHSESERAATYTPGMDEVVIWDAVQRLVHRIDKQAREIESLKGDLGQAAKFDPHPVDRALAREDEKHRSGERSA